MLNKIIKQNKKDGVQPGDRVQWDTITFKELMIELGIPHEKVDDIIKEMSSIKES